MKPDKLQKVAMVGMFALILISFALANVHSFLWVNSKWLVSTILPAVVTSETNEARAAEDVPPLVRNELLDRAAQMKAEDMAARGYFAHKSPDGLLPWYWFKEAGYNYAYAGENLAVHFTDSTAVVDAWLESPSHRANVMNGDYREIGIGTAKGEYEGFDTVFVVQLFGTPAIPPAPTPITRPNATLPQAVAQIEDPVPLEEEVAAVAPSVTDEGTVVLESFAATEISGAVLAEIAPSETDDAKSVLRLGRIATSPSTVLQIAYSFIGLIVMSLLSYTLVFEWKHHHPAQTAYSAGLLVAMIALFMVHSFISQTAVIL